MAEDKKGKCSGFLKDNALTIGTFVGVLFGKYNFIDMTRTRIIISSQASALDLH